MPGTLRTIETKLATMSLVAPGYIEQRFRVGVAMDREGFEENRQVRHMLGGAAPYVMLSVIPEGVDFQLDVVTIDHFGMEPEGSGLSALAVVAGDNLLTSITHLFFKYFPPSFPARVFNNEAGAQAWLATLRT